MDDDRDPKLLETEIRPIAFAAQRLLELGLVVVPCDAKRPLIKGWSCLTKAQVRRLSRKWPERFPGANVAIVCGASSIVVVDIDDADLLPQMIERFGETPILIASPSGGFHAYYRNLDPPVGCLNLRQKEGLPVDIKGDGGLVVAPPSLNRATGGVYQFFRGSWADLGSLPVIRSSGLPADRARGRPSSLARTKIARRVKIGQRNDTLFSEGLKHAPYCDDFDTLLDVIQTKNAFLLEAPLSEVEVLTIAQSAWRYEQEGHNWSGKSARTLLTREELLYFASHKNGGNALMLWSYLEGQHARRAEPLVLDRIAMTEANLLPGWSQWRYRQTIKTLLRSG